MSGKGKKQQKPRKKNGRKGKQGQFGQQMIMRTRPNVIPRTVVGNVSRGITISHREYIGSINAYADCAFEPHIFHLNPGTNAVFRWLAPIASRFERYRVKKFEVEWVPSLGALEPGNITMAIDHDPEDPDWEEVANLLNSQDSVTGPLRNPLKLTLRQKNLNGLKTYYTRVQEELIVNDLRLSDFGKLYVLATGGPATSTHAGMYFANYTFEFMIPQIPEDMSYVYEAQSSTPTVHPTLLMQSAVEKVQQSDIQDVAGRFYSRVGGEFLMNVYALGTTLVGGNILTTGGSIATLVKQMVNATATEYLGTWLIEDVGNPTGVLINTWAPRVEGAAVTNAWMSITKTIDDFLPFT
jgi:hypothetical protein